MNLTSANHKLGHLLVCTYVYISLSVGSLTHPKPVHCSIEPYYTEVDGPMITFGLFLFQKRWSLIVSFTSAKGIQISVKWYIAPDDTKIKPRHQISLWTWIKMMTIFFSIFFKFNKFFTAMRIQLFCWYS